LEIDVILWRGGGERMEIEEQLDAYFSSIVREKDALEHFSQYVCPELYGYDDVKKAILLMLVSDDDHPNIRGRIHIGLVGEPGTGKTVFMEYLEREHNAVYLTQDTTISTLKGDARRKDYGVQIFRRANNGIVCFDEIELMEDRETLRDVMEKGEVIYAKGGDIERYEAKVRVVVGSNSFKKLSPALQDRLDFIFQFEMPTKDESKKIARKIVKILMGENYMKEAEILREYICWAKRFKPVIQEEEKIGEVFDQYFDWIGEGRSGRFITKVMRIATAHAKLSHKDVTAENVKVALKLMNHSKKIGEG